MKFTAKNFNELSSLELYEILKARSQVFIVEQNMRCQDMDGVDLTARHFALLKDGKVLAYLRAFYDDDKKKRRQNRQGTVGYTRHRLGQGDYEKSH